MKITLKQLREIIKESLNNQENSENVVSEFWGRKKSKASSSDSDKPRDSLSVADSEMRKVVSALWGPWDDPPRPDLLKKAQELHKEIQDAVKSSKES